MANSMTAYGRSKQEAGNKIISVEIKSVNSRYLDCSVKLPRNYLFLEEKVRALMNASGIYRGKVDVLISIESTGDSGTVIELDRSMAASYIAALRTLAEEFSLPCDMDIMSLARNQNLFLIKEAEENAEQNWAELKTVLEDALANFKAMRKSEGERLIADLCEKKNTIMALIPQIKEYSAQNAQSYKEKLKLRIQQILADNRVEPDEQRLLTECAIFADRIAVDEELVRLQSHFEAFESIIAENEPIGRKLDFLIQEMNREINTVGSKSNSIDITKLVITIKSEIEKIREQIQNIE